MTTTNYDPLFKKIKKTTEGTEVSLSNDQLRALWNYINDNDLFTTNQCCVGRGATLRWEYECKIDNWYFEFHSYATAEFKIISGSHF